MYLEEEPKLRKKNSMQVILTLLLLVGLVGGFGFAFFNYTRTGLANTLRLGEIEFNYTQGSKIELNNIFPISVERDANGNITNTEGVGEVEILIDGKTTYSEGIEYLVSSVNSNLSIPVNIDIQVINNGEGTNNNLGTSDDDYFTNREIYTTSHYKKMIGDKLTKDEKILVGFIASNNDNTNNSVNGKIVIKAYIDKDKIAITDTIDNIETQEWAGNRTIVTTEEWNSLQENGLSFQVKVEANLGIWVNKAINPSMLRYSLLPNGTYAILGFNKSSASGESSGETSGESSGETSGETGDNNFPTDLIIPGRINGVLVTVIGDHAFTSNQLTSVMIPNSVTTIGEGAFASNQLTSVEIPNNVITIGPCAFCNNRLTSVTMGNSVTTIENNAFYKNQLTSIDIPNNVTTIGNNAFEYNPLISVEIPNSVTTIGYFAFAHNQLTSVTIGNSVTTIGNSAFAHNQLISVTMGNSVTTIGNSAFENNQLTSVEIPDSVTTINALAFYNNRLKSVEIPNSVTTIGNIAFGTNYSLTNLKVNKTCTEIKSMTNQTWNNWGVPTNIIRDSNGQSCN